MQGAAGRDSFSGGASMPVADKYALRHSSSVGDDPAEASARGQHSLNTTADVGSMSGYGMQQLMNNTAGPAGPIHTAADRAGLGVLHDAPPGGGMMSEDKQDVSPNSVHLTISSAFTSAAAAAAAATAATATTIAANTATAGKMTEGILGQQHAVTGSEATEGQDMDLNHASSSAVSKPLACGVPQHDTKRLQHEGSVLTPPPDAKRQRTPGLQGNRSGSCSGRQPSGRGVMADADVGLPPAEEVDATSYKDVVLRIEFARSWEVKALSYLMMATLLAGIAITIYIKISAHNRGTSWYVSSDNQVSFQDNLITGSICLLISSLLWALYVFRGTWLLLQRLQWDHRRHRTYLVRLAELSCIIINYACWTYSSSERRLEENCDRFNATLLWTYAVRLSLSNTLLCLWTLTARGMTVWRGGPLTWRQRLAISAQLRLVNWCGHGLAAGDALIRAAGGSWRRSAAAGMPASAATNAAAGATAGHQPPSAIKDRDSHQVHGSLKRLDLPAGQEPAASPPLPSEPGRPPPLNGLDGQVADPTAVAMADAVVKEVAQLDPPTAAAMVADTAAIDASALAAGARSIAGLTGQPETSTSVAQLPEGLDPVLAGATIAAINEAAEAEAASTDEQLYIDAPWWEYLAPFAWLWVPFQCLVGINIGLIAASVKNNQTYDQCIEWFLECKSANAASFVFHIVMLAAEVVYVIVYFTHCLRAFSYLRSRSYVLCRQLNIYLSVEVRIRGITLLYIVANDIVQTFYVPKVDVPGEGEEHCRYSLDNILGVWSTQVIFLVLVCTLAWLFIPRSTRSSMPIMQATLQRFAWTEPDLPRQLARRLSSLPAGCDHVGQLSREPMFCFETCVKLCYWCEHIYYYDEPGCVMRLPLEQLMKLYDLEHVQVIREEESDAKVMIAWSWKMCVICFRGTASLKAACIDLKAMLKPYYNREVWAPEFKLASLAAVHHGFQWSWLHRDFNRRVMDWVTGYRNKHPHGKLLVTGHSLGGAHATLCTLDIMHELRDSLPPHHISCYTYGAPRVGNHAFAAMYDRVVYETWNVVNCNDMVPLTPKCVGWFVYKHPGHKVIVKRRGDLIVRPTFTENAVARLPCSRSVRHHLLGSYLRSMMAVLRAQTRGKHVEGGVRGLLHLTIYGLPEVDAVLADVVEEVQAVALAAVEAVQLVEKRNLAAGAAATPAEVAVVAAAAAAKTSAAGGAVYHSLAKYGSIRLLMDQESRKTLRNSVQQATSAAYAATASSLPAALAAEAAAAGSNGVTAEVVGGEPLGAPAPSGGSAVLKMARPRAVLHELAKRLNMGMELMGVETGLSDDDDPAPATRPGVDFSSAAGGVVRSRQSAATPGGAAPPHTTPPRRQAGAPSSASHAALSQWRPASKRHDSPAAGGARTGSVLSSMPTVSPNEIAAFERAKAAQHEAHALYKRNKEVRQTLAKESQRRRSSVREIRSANSRPPTVPTASRGGQEATPAPQSGLGAHALGAGDGAPAENRDEQQPVNTTAGDRNSSARRRLHAKRQAARNHASPAQAELAELAGCQAEHRHATGGISPLEAPAAGPVAEGWEVPPWRADGACTPSRNLDVSVDAALAAAVVASGIRRAAESADCCLSWAPYYESGYKCKISNTADMV